MKEYLVKLDEDLKPQDWWNICTLIKPLTTKLEIISIIIPIILIKINESDLDLVVNMFGVVLVEDNCYGKLI